MTRIGMACTKCGNNQAFSYDHVTCACGGSLLVQYDMELAAKTMTKQAIQSRPSSMWRYKELLPVSSPEDVVSLGEGWTPLSYMNIQGIGLPVDHVWIKREELNPTGSFKARGMSVAVSLLKERKARYAAVSSNGNAASALAAYAGCAGIEAIVFLPEDCPPLIVQECLSYGARTFRVQGLIQDAGQWVEAGKHLFGWSTVATLKEPGRVEGKKTMGFELAEQLGWKLPSVIIYPTGGGSGLIGMWKAFHELKQMGMIADPLPRMVSVQDAGCSPLVSAMGNHATVLDAPAATGMRVPRPPDIDLLLHILKETGGKAVAVNQVEIDGAQRYLGYRGVSSSPEGAATWAGLLKLCEEGWIRRDDSVVLFNTCHGLKYGKSLGLESVPLLANLKELFYHTS
ncbi:threonine synthase [Cohnella silvisoli]|uniref:Threonine synthase n=1 Tax=Cohnella silvisoli TaxID=2873699 RepID=A0ABV1L2Q5_9BACL|nr:threonine synthase [Cohnella silvisoli]MCD9026481.1 threonine synthase [Cohnella silvisoli]